MTEACSLSARRILMAITRSRSECTVQRHLSLPDEKGSSDVHHSRSSVLRAVMTRALRCEVRSECGPSERRTWCSASARGNRASQRGLPLNERRAIPPASLLPVPKSMKSPRPFVPPYVESLQCLQCRPKLSRPAAHCMAPLHGDGFRRLVNLWTYQTCSLPFLASVQFPGRSFIIDRTVLN